MPQTAGELNYVLTGYVLQYLRTHGESYQTYCEIEGVLGHISMELYRRRLAAYEDEAIRRNGDLEGYQRKEDPP